MNSLRFLPVLLALGLVVGCTKSDASDTMKSAGDAAKGAVDSTKDAAGKAAEGAMGALDSLKNMDVSKFATMDAAKLTDMGKNAMSAVAAQLGSIKDLASAKTVTSALEPMMEKLSGLKTALNGKLPNMESVTNAISSLKTKFAGDNAIMGVIQPLLDKLKGLVG